MPGYLLTVGATTMCMHGGQAQASSPNARVRAASQPTVQQTSLYTVAACPFNSGGAPTPCVTGQWLTGSLRVKSGGMPLLLQDSLATCIPNGTGINVVMTQTRVRAQ